MLISIIIPSFNQGNYIEQTICSILNQDYQHIELIIVDNNSTDNTNLILNKYLHKIKLISEKDFGQSDALNKGLKLASGDIIGWINSDDYYEKGIFKKVSELFENTNVKWVIGNLYYLYDELGLIIEQKTTKIDYKKLLKNPDIVQQSAAFYRKNFLEVINGVNKSFHMAMDFDIWTKLAKISTPLMTDNYIAYYRIHKGQKSDGKFILLQAKEINIILKKEGRPLIHRMIFLYKRYILFIKFFIKDKILKLKSPSIPLNIKFNAKNKSSNS